MTLRGAGCHLRADLLEKTPAGLLIGKHPGHAYLKPHLVGEFVALAIVMAGRCHLVEGRKQGLANR